MAREAMGQINRNLHPQLVHDELKTIGHVFDSLFGALSAAVAAVVAYKQENRIDLAIF